MTCAFKISSKFLGILLGDFCFAKTLDFLILRSTDCGSKSTQRAQQWTLICIFRRCQYDRRIRLLHCRSRRRPLFLIWEGSGFQKQIIQLKVNQRLAIGVKIRIVRFIRAPNSGNEFLKELLQSRSVSSWHR